MQHILALILGFCVDLILGDPRGLPHPVQGMGWLIEKFETLLRRVFPASPRGQMAAEIGRAHV